MRIYRSLPVAVVLLVSGTILLNIVPISAQDATAMGSSSLAAMLRFVPDTQDANDSISYSDFRASEAGRRLEVVPVDYPFFETMSDDARRLWAATLPTASGIKLPYYTTLDDMTPAMGIDFFQIDRSLIWGSDLVPNIILQGRFDEAAIGAAHEARDFTKLTIENYPAWCGLEGCDAGLVTNISAAEPADLFGGDFGQYFPRVLVNNLLISSGALENVEAMITAGVTGSDTIADDPAYQAAVAALDGEHYLRGAQFASVSHFRYTTSLRIPDKSDDEMRGGEANLAPYWLAVIADIATAENEAVVVELVYRDEEVATNAGEIVVERLASSWSAYHRRPWADVITARGASVETPRVYHHEASGYYVTLITLTEPLDPLEQDETGRYSPSSLLFQVLMTGYQHSDLGWLEPVLFN